ncbi:MAG: response regulator, partial [Flavobacteriales bacterium]|nr:response regulator [Flavobacteriales bacterium]
MKKISCIIVDDESKNRQVLMRMIEDFCPDVQVLGEAESVKQAARMVVELEPDVVFLDVEMPEEEGFKLLEYVDNRNFWVVFVTAHSHYALQAIKTAALDYIMKPV